MYQLEENYRIAYTTSQNGNKNKSTISHEKLIDQKFAAFFSFIAKNISHFQHIQSTQWKENLMAGWSITFRWNFYTQRSSYAHQT